MRRIDQLSRLEAACLVADEWLLQKARIEHLVGLEYPHLLGRALDQLERTTRGSRLRHVTRSPNADADGGEGMGGG